MSPTVFRYKGYRFFFFSREEERKHVHVYSVRGEAKFWLEPEISLAQNHGIPEKEINKLYKIIRDKEDAIKASWRKHFGG